MLLNLYTWILIHLPQKEEGQDVTEYALLIALIAIVVVFAITFFGSEISSWFKNLSSAITLK